MTIWYHAPTLQPRRGKVARNVVLKVAIEQLTEDEDPQERLSEVLFDVALSVKEAADVEGGPIRLRGTTIGVWALKIQDAGTT
jgi:hypothetical protein